MDDEIEWRVAMLERENETLRTTLAMVGAMSATALAGRRDGAADYVPNVHADTFRL